MRYDHTAAATAVTSVLSLCPHCTGTHAHPARPPALGALEQVNTVFGAKRLMGKPFAEVDKGDLSHWPFHVEADEDGMPEIHVEFRSKKHVNLSLPSPHSQSSPMPLLPTSRAPCGTLLQRTASAGWRAPAAAPSPLPTPSRAAPLLQSHM